MIFLNKIKKLIEFWYFKKTFKNKFIYYTTNNAKELDELYKIRYQVYCEEYNYLDKKNYVNQKESDIYDNVSVHFVLRDKKNNNIAATVRLILNTELGFPIEKNFKVDIHVPIKNRNSMAEISRLIVSRKYRKRYLLLALIKGLYAYIKFNKLTHIYSVLDDKLYPTLTDIGFPFKEIGSPTTYQGITSPYILDIAEMEHNLHYSNPKLYKYIKQGLIVNTKNTNQYSIY